MRTSFSTSKKKVLQEVHKFRYDMKYRYREKMYNFVIYLYNPPGLFLLRLMSVVSVTS